MVGAMRQKGETLDLVIYWRAIGKRKWAILAFALGITIATGLFLGMERPAAARFAFLMGIPVIAGATLFKLRDIAFGSLSSTDALALVAGMVAAAISGVLAIRFLLSYLQNHNTDIFVAYRIGFAVLVAVLLLLR